MNVVRRTWTFVSSAAPQLLRYNIALQMLQALLPFAAFYAIKLIVDQLIEAIRTGQIDEWQLTWYLVAFSATTIIISLVKTLANRNESLLQMRLNDHIAAIIQRKSLQMDLEYYEDPDMRDTFHRAQVEAGYRPYQIIRAILSLIQSVFFILFIAVFFIANGLWFVMFLITVGGIPGLILKTKMSRRQYQVERALVPHERKSYFLNGILTMDDYAKEARIFNFGEKIMSQYQRLRRRIYDQRKSWHELRTRYDMIGEVIEASVVTTCIWWASLQTIRGAMQVGTLVMYLQVLQRAQAQYRTLISAMAQVYSHRLFLRNLYEFLDLKMKIDDPKKGVKKLTAIAPVFRLEKVSFRYPSGGRDWALREVNLEIRPGERVALVGLNGSGKSTIVKLLGRLYDPTKGRITYGGMDFKNIELDVLRREVSIAFQEAIRYDLTIRENITLGDVHRKTNLEDIRTAAQFTGADSFIEKLPRGYHTMLGHAFAGGTELSGGQLQLIALTRAMYKRASLVILDEPMNQLDPLVEQAFVERLYARHHRQAVLFVTHRLRHLRIAERIVVLHEGRIVEEGNFHELMALDGLFAKMFRSSDEVRAGGVPV